MTIQSQPFNASCGILVDTSTKITLASGTRLWADGVRGIWRYFFFGSPRPNDLDAPELQMLLGIGFWVGGVQHVPNPSWIASGTLGTQHAQSAIANAIRAGFVTPEGQHPIALSLDAEGVGNPGPAMVDYARSGFQARTTHHYQSVGYNGFDCGMRGVDLDDLNADITCGDPAWWCDFALLAQRPSPKKGYAGHQKAQSIIAGVDVDEDQVLQDGVLYGLIDADLNTETVDPRELPTVPLPFHVMDTERPPPPSKP